MRTEPEGGGASPRPRVLLLTEVFVGHGGHEEDRVPGPLLDAGQVEEGEAAAAAPHLQGAGQVRRRSTVGAELRSNCHQQTP